MVIQTALNSYNKFNWEKYGLIDFILFFQVSMLLSLDEDI